jgi:hypothetical protein
MMLVGTAAAFVAVSTGESAGELAERTAGVQGVLERHEELGETARNIFAALTGVFAVMLAAGWYFRAKLSMATTVVAIVVFLGAYGAGSLVLMNAGHLGGRLVHELGVRALMGPEPAPATVDGAGGLSTGREDDDD